MDEGEYQFEISAENGTIQVINNLRFNFIPYAPEEMHVSFTSFIYFFGLLGGALFAMLIVLRIKNINFESYIYFKNKKIIPFFKPIVFGPLSFDVNEMNIKKAEFYVNGKLKDTLTQEPYKWYFNENAFMKHTIEAKVYDIQGKSSSTGEMTFFVINSPKLFK
jgi:hypothetical protein